MISTDHRPWAQAASIRAALSAWCGAGAETVRMKVVGEVCSVEMTLNGTKLSPFRTPLGVLPKGLPMSVAALRSATPRRTIVRVASRRPRRGFLSSPFARAADMHLGAVLVKPRAGPLGRIEEASDVRVSCLHRGMDALLFVVNLRAPGLIPACLNCSCMHVSGIGGGITSARPWSRHRVAGLVRVQLAMLEDSSLTEVTSATRCMCYGLVKRSWPRRGSKACVFDAITCPTTSFRLQSEYFKCEYESRLVCLVHSRAMNPASIMLEGDGNCVVSSKDARFESYVAYFTATVAFVSQSHDVLYYFF